MRAQHITGGKDCQRFSYLLVAQRPETAVQGYVNTFLTATIMTAAVVILADSIRRWFGMGKRPESLVTLVDAELAT